MNINPSERVGRVLIGLAGAIGGLLLLASASTGGVGAGPAAVGGGLAV